MTNFIDLSSQEQFEVNGGSKLIIGAAAVVMAAGLVWVGIQIGRAIGDTINRITGR